jgi:hypothetical protein
MTTKSFNVTTTITLNKHTLPVGDYWTLSEPNGPGTRWEFWEVSKSEWRLEYYADEHGDPEIEERVIGTLTEAIRVALDNPNIYAAKQHA